MPQSTTSDGRDYVTSMGADEVVGDMTAPRPASMEQRSLLFNFAVKDVFTAMDTDLRAARNVFELGRVVANFSCIIALKFLDERISSGRQRGKPAGSAQTGTLSPAMRRAQEVAERNASATGADEGSSEVSGS